jgi:hypothetical protein
MPRRLAHVAALHRRAWMVADVGVEKARGVGGKYCQASMAGVPSRGRSAWAVRHTIAHAVMRDRRPEQAVLRRRPEDDHVQVSGGSLHAGCLWAHEQSTMVAHGACVLANFAGVWCLDAVQDSGRTIVLATAPLGACTVSCTLVETNAQDPMHAC